MAKLLAVLAKEKPLCVFAAFLSLLTFVLVVGIHSTIELVHELRGTSSHERAHAETGMPDGDLATRRAPR